MRRTIALVPVLGLGLFGAVVGCKHIGGKHDCGAYPTDAVIAPPGNPYPFAPAGVVVPPGGPKTPVIPPANGKDAKEPKKERNEGISLPSIETEQIPTFKPAPPQDN